MRTQWEGDHLQARGDISAEPDHAGTLILDLHPPELRGGTFLFFKLSILWYFVIVVWVNRFSLMPQWVKNPPAMQETWVWSLGQVDPLEKKMATHSSILAGEMPWTEEPGVLRPCGCKKSDLTEHRSTWIWIVWAHTDFDTKQCAALTDI